MCDRLCMCAAYEMMWMASFGLFLGPESVDEQDWVSSDLAGCGGMQMIGSYSFKAS